jgi:Raf kinase inhibitor-like YbhB/YbcL family protein
MKRLALVALAVMFLFSSPVLAAEAEKEQFSLTSPAFADGKIMPGKYRYYAENRSPVLAWKNAPEGTKSFMITCIDYDARRVAYRPWLHWEIYNIPASYAGLPEGVPKGKAWQDGIAQSRNDAGDYGWSGPYPPDGDHRYDFVIYALDVPTLQSTKADYIKQHTLATAKLVGVSGR